MAESDGHQPRAFTADSVLRNLNNNVLPVFQTLLNGGEISSRCSHPSTSSKMMSELWIKAAVQTNIHEGCFHARHYPHDPTSKNIANISASIVSLNKISCRPFSSKATLNVHQRDINEDLFARDCASSFPPTAAGGSQSGTPNSASKAAVSNKAGP